MECEIWQSGKGSAKAIKKKKSVLSEQMDATLPPIQIARGLYLGHEIHAATKPLLIEHNIHYIVNAAGNQVNNHFADFDFEYLPLDLYDTTADDIHQYFASTFEFIGTLYRRYYLSKG